MAAVFRRPIRRIGCGGCLGLLRNRAKDISKGAPQYLSIIRSMRCPRPGLVTLAIKGRGSGGEESLLVNKFLQCRGIVQSVHDQRIREMR
jgi:hypothetical protein